jgi:hypothetical protein
MTIKKRDLSLIILFLIFVTVGVYGLNSVDFIAGEETMEYTFKYCGVPILLIAAYYAYRSTFGYDKDKEAWKNTLGFVVMTFIAGMVIFISFQGLLVLINCNLGHHKEYNLEGQITYLDYPEKKKALNKYSIEIKRIAELDTIKLDVPTNDYEQGQYFTKKMKIGSLGFIYARE